jgi:hypothetical protein
MQPNDFPEIDTLRPRVSAKEPIAMVVAHLRDAVMHPRARAFTRFAASLRSAVLARIAPHLEWLGDPSRGPWNGRASTALMPCPWNGSEAIDQAGPQDTLGLLTRLALRLADSVPAATFARALSESLAAGSHRAATSRGPQLR